MQAVGEDSVHAVLKISRFGHGWTIALEHDVWVCQPLFQHQRLDRWTQALQDALFGRLPSACSRGASAKGAVRLGGPGCRGLPREAWLVQSRRHDAKDSSHVLSAGQVQSRRLTQSNGVHGWIHVHWSY